MVGSLVLTQALFGLVIGLGGAGVAWFSDSAPSCHLADLVFRYRDVMVEGGFDDPLGGLKWAGVISNDAEARWVACEVAEANSLDEIADPLQMNRDAFEITYATQMQHYYAGQYREVEVIATQVLPALEDWEYRTFPLNATYEEMVGPIDNWLQRFGPAFFFKLIPGYGVTSCNAMTAEEVTSAFKETSYRDFLRSFSKLSGVHRDTVDMIAYSVGQTLRHGSKAAVESLTAFADIMDELESLGLTKLSYDPTKSAVKDV